MTYILGPKSLQHLEGVHPDLVAVVHGAIKLTTQDFGVHEGLRSIETQKKYVDAGVSKTMDSKHLLQPDGLGHAVDLVPYIDGTLRWEWPPIYKVASAVQATAISLNVKLRWGGVWDKVLNDLGPKLEAEVHAYGERHPGPDFLDGPHFELHVTNSTLPLDVAPTV